MSTNYGWYGFDLDQTLAEYHAGDYSKYGASFIGKPIPRMVERVKWHLSQGHEVRICTARLDPRNDEPADVTIARIQDWTEQHIGVRLPVTNMKDFDMIVLYDDRARQIVPNEGIVVGE